MGLFDDLTVSTLSASMRGLELRQTAISENIANAETPGYRRVDVAFEDRLASAVADQAGENTSGMNRLRSTSFAQASLTAAAGDSAMAQQNATRASGSNANAVDRFTSSLSVDGSTYMRYDGSSVDPDQEMALLAANQLAYQTVSQFLAKKFSQFSYAINGR